MAAVLSLVPLVGVLAACAALAMSRATFYRRQSPVPVAAARPTPSRALSADERTEVLAVLHSERFVDKAPRQVVAELLDEGHYLCSVRTMYRLLDDAGEVRERRDQTRLMSDNYFCRSATTTFAGAVDVRTAG